MIRVVLVEDHGLVRSGLRHLLEARGPIQVVGEVGTGQEALALLEAVEADVAILDVSLPDCTGIELCRTLRERFPKLRLLALSMHEDLEYVRGFLQAGGQGYVSKAAVDQELLDAVLALARGGTVPESGPGHAPGHGDRPRGRGRRTPLPAGGGGTSPFGQGSFPQGGGGAPFHIGKNRGHLPGAGYGEAGAEKPQRPSEICGQEGLATGLTQGFALCVSTLRCG